MGTGVMLCDWCSCLFLTMSSHNEQTSVPYIWQVIFFYISVNGLLKIYSFYGCGKVLPLPVHIVDVFHWCTVARSGLVVIYVSRCLYLFLEPFPVVSGWLPNILPTAFEPVASLPVYYSTLSLIFPLSLGVHKMLFKVLPPLKYAHVIYFTYIFDVFT